MIKNIIFDLAGVLLNLDLEQDTRALHSLGLPDFDECLRRPEICRPTLAYLNGILPGPDFCHQIRPLCRAGVTDQEILAGMDAVLGDLPLSRLKWLKELRQKYRVFLLSNLNESAWQYTQRQFAAHGVNPNDCFDQIFLSYQLQLAKPDPRIYQHVIAQTGILPAETLYFDDTRENVEAGNALGLHSVLVPMNQLEEIVNFLSRKSENVYRF